MIFGISRSSNCVILGGIIPSYVNKDCKKATRIRKLMKQPRFSNDLKKKSQGFRSVDRIVHCNTLFKYSRIYRLKCDAAPSRKNHIVWLTFNGTTFRSWGKLRCRNINNLQRPFEVEERMVQ